MSAPAYGAKRSFTDLTASVPAVSAALASCVPTYRRCRSSSSFTGGVLLAQCSDPTSDCSDDMASCSITLKFYDILLAHAAYIQVVSMDECLAEVDVPPTVFRDQDPAVDLARRLREQIFEATGCEASIGISHNILLARLAMRKAKPASIFHLFPEDVDDFLLGLDVDALPGIGWSMRAKLLQELSVKTVADLRRVSPAKLAEVIGPGNSKKFAAYASGVDDSELESQKLRQSVSTEVNYGIRFGPERIDQVEVCRLHCPFVERLIFADLIPFSASSASSVMRRLNVSVPPA